MDIRRNLYVAAFVGASLSYIFNVLAFTGTFDVFRWFVFAVIFLGFTYGFENWEIRFEAWNERGFWLSNSFNTFEATTTPAVFTADQQGWVSVDGQLTEEWAGTMGQQGSNRCHSSPSIKSRHQDCSGSQ